MAIRIIICGWFCIIFTTGNGHTNHYLWFDVHYLMEKDVFVTINFLTSVFFKNSIVFLSGFHNGICASMGSLELKWIRIWFLFWWYLLAVGVLDIKREGFKYINSLNVANHISIGLCLIISLYVGWGLTQTVCLIRNRNGFTPGGFCGVCVIHLFSFLCCVFCIVCFCSVSYG